MEIKKILKIVMLVIIGSIDAIGLSANVEIQEKTDTGQNTSETVATPAANDAAYFENIMVRMQQALEAKDLNRIDEKLIATFKNLIIESKDIKYIDQLGSMFENSIKAALKSKDIEHVDQLFTAARKILYVEITDTMAYNYQFNNDIFSNSINIALETKDLNYFDQLCAIAEKHNISISPFSYAYQMQTAVESKDFDHVDKLLTIVKKHNIYIAHFVFQDEFKKAINTLSSNPQLALNIFNIAKKFTSDQNPLSLKSYLQDSLTTALKQNNIQSAKDLFNFIEQANLLEEFVQNLGNHWKKACAAYPKLAEFLITEKKRTVQQATDITAEEKEIILNFYDQLQIEKLIQDDNSQYMQELCNHPAAQLPPKIIATYCPLISLKQLQLSTQLNFKETLTALHAFAGSNIFADIVEHTNQHIKENSQVHNQDDPTVTERLCSNIVSNDKMIYHCLLSQTLNPATPNLDFYNSNFVLALQQSGILEKVNLCEKKSKAQGCETFYHGRRWSWNFVNDIFNMIQATVQNKPKPSNRISLRYRTDNCDIDKLLKYRQDLMTNKANERVLTSTNKSGRFAEITFMNKTIVSNSGPYGECTGIYFLQNQSLAPSDAEWNIAKQLFQDHGLADYFTKHEQEIKDLFELHKQTSRFGELLAIKFNKHQVNELVYLATSGGFNIPGQSILRSTSMHTANNERKIKSYSGYSDSYVTSRTMYCFAVSDIPGEYGKKYTIESLNMVDEKKYQQYLQARNALFTNMKEEHVSKKSHTNHEPLIQFGNNLPPQVLMHRTVSTI